jgi:hypothetical protein
MASGFVSCTWRGGIGAIDPHPSAPFGGQETELMCPKVSTEHPVGTEVSTERPAGTVHLVLLPLLVSLWPAVPC